jgi:uncharacterized cupredoxin-like copper-binding protein
MSNVRDRLESSSAESQRYGRRTFFALLAGSLVALAGAGRASLAWSREGAAAVSVRLKEFKVIPSVRSVRAGRVVFTARNTGKLPHNLVVLRTNLAPGKLPVVGSVAKEVGRRGKTPVFGPGKSRRLALELKPGKYVLLCNVAGHYKAGMFIGFTVR